MSKGPPNGPAIDGDNNPPHGPNRPRWSQAQIASRGVDGPKGADPEPWRGCFALPVSYQRDRSRTPCAVMTATSWYSVLLRRKTQRLLPSASVVRICWVD
jgi:hypothetical protein